MENKKIISTTHKNKPFSRRDLLKTFGFGAALLLSSCVSKANNSPSEAVTKPQSNPSDANIVSTETDSAQTNGTETSQVAETNSPPTEAPTEIPKTIAEKLAQIQIPLILDPLAKDEWKDIPEIPTSLSERALGLFALSLELGRDGRRFSVVGDCQTIPSYFLGNFENSANSNTYALGETYAYLQETIDYYKGSFKGGVATKGGQNVAAVFSPIWVQPEFASLCAGNEGPLACELRLSNASFVFIALEENWNGDTVGYISNLEKVVLYAISQGVIPILSTKANNLEGDHSVNQAIVELARRYEIPLWNFWKAVQPLPSHGLDEDMFHLSVNANPVANIDTRFDFSDPSKINAGLTMHNLSALILLDFMRKSLAPEIGLGHQLIFMLERWILNS